MAPLAHFRVKDSAQKHLSRSPEKMWGEVLGRMGYRLMPLLVQWAYNVFEILAWQVESKIYDMFLANLIGGLTEVHVLLIYWSRNLSPTL